MNPGYSKLLVYKLIVPEREASTWMVTQDFNMMTLCATVEKQWRQTLSEASLKVVGVYLTKDGVPEGIIEAEI